VESISGPKRGELIASVENLLGELRRQFLWRFNFGLVISHRPFELFERHKHNHVPGAQSHERWPEAVKKKTNRGRKANRLELLLCRKETKTIKCLSIRERESLVFLLLLFGFSYFLAGLWSFPITIPFNILYNFSLRSC